MSSFDHFGGRAPSSEGLDESSRISPEQADARLAAIRRTYGSALTDLNQALGSADGTAEERRSLLQVIIDSERRLEVAEFVKEQTDRLPSLDNGLQGLERRIQEHPESCQNMTRAQLCRLFDSASPTTLRSLVEYEDFENVILAKSFPTMLVMKEDGKIDLQASLSYGNGREHSFPSYGLGEKEPLTVSLWQFLRDRINSGTRRR